MGIINKETVVIIGAGYAGYRIACILAFLVVAALPFYLCDLFICRPLGIGAPWANTPEQPYHAPTPSERRAAEKVESNKELAEPNILVAALEKAIANRNIPEIHRLYKASIFAIDRDNDGGRPHLVFRDCTAMLKIIETCPDIPDKEWGLSQIRYMLSRAKGIWEKDTKRRLDEAEYEKTLRKTGTYDVEYNPQAVKSNGS